MGTGFPFPDSILCDLHGGQPRDIFRQIARDLERKGGIDPTDLTELLTATESAGNAVIGDGVAVLGLRAPLANRRLCGMARLARPVPFKSNGQHHPCDTVFILISPEPETQAHIRDLSAIVRSMRDPDFMESLRAQTAPDRIMNIFRARDIALHRAA